LQVIPNEPNHPNRKTISFPTIHLTRQPLTKKVQKVQKVQPWEISRIAPMALWAAAKRADEGGPVGSAWDPEGGGVSAREVLEELDRLAISIFYRPLGDGAGAGISVGVGRERVYPELLGAIEERTPELLKIASFEPSRHTPGTYLRRPGGSA
jgi:hypothetical protein